MTRRTYWGLGAGERSALTYLAVKPEGRTETLASWHWVLTGLVADGLVEIVGTDREETCWRGECRLACANPGICPEDTAYARAAAGKVPGLRVPSGTRSVTYRLTAEGRRVGQDRTC